MNRVNRGILAWWALCLCLGLPALWTDSVPLNQATSTWPAMAQSWALHPDAGLHQPPWVWWSTAWLHGSSLHLWRNLAGLLLLAWLGWLTRIDCRATSIWALCWPLTQLGMLWQPELHTYIGLSGVLHAGVGVVSLHLMAGNRPSLPRWVGWALCAGLIAKLIMENPCGPALIRPLGSDITVAPWAHLSGSLSATVLSLSHLLYRRRRIALRASSSHRTLI